MNDKTKTKAALKQQRTNTIPAPKRTIDYQVDTLSTSTKIGAHFSPSNNTINVNFIKNKNNSFNESKATKAHEQKHRDNFIAGIENMPMSLEQYYSVCVHDEISANIAELLQLREEYKNAKTDKERETIVSSQSGKKFSYYFNTVKKGTITPFATTSADFEKEMRFIATETQKKWIKNYYASYDADFLDDTKIHFCSHSYKDLKSNPENYEKAQKIAYTIGGIDFTQYMEELPYINKNLAKADKMIENNQSRFAIENTIQHTAKNNTPYYTPSDTNDKIYHLDYYTGTPRYASWSPNKRVSPVLTAKIYDMTSPFLKQQQELLAQKDAEKAQQEALLAQNQVRTDKFNKKVEASRGAKASDKDKKKTTTKQTTKTQTKQPEKKQATR